MPPSRRQLNRQRPSGANKQCRHGKGLYTRKEMELLLKHDPKRTFVKCGCGCNRYA